MAEPRHPSPAQHRDTTVNSGRITEVKQDDSIRPASKDVLAFFKSRKRSYDPSTGLNLIDDERLVRAREAMSLGVQTYNSRTLNFKTEVFSILANIAWTYLLHEFYLRKKIKIVSADGMYWSLSQMIRRSDCPISKGAKDNIKSLKIIRDEVEHKLLRKSDAMWLSLFQACCLNFDKTISDLFGESLSLQKELAFALQFGKMNVDQASTLQKYDIPDYVEALDARLKEGMTEEQLSNLDYQFRVVYTLDSASKSRAHIEFLHPSTEEAETVRNVLAKIKLADDLYPHKPNMVVYLVASGSGKKFTSHNHIQAWHKYKVRPVGGAAQPENTDKEYCIYHKAHNDYTYSESWVEFLVKVITTANGLDDLKAYRN